MQDAEFKRPDGPIVMGMGVAIVLAALTGVGFVLVFGGGVDRMLRALAFFGMGLACLVGYGMINAGRQPMLVIRPDAFFIPTFFGARRIPLRPHHPLGEFLAVPDRGKDADRFTQFFTLDAKGGLVELVALHHRASELSVMRRGFREVAGLKIDILQPDPASKQPMPDVAHWTR